MSDAPRIVTLPNALTLARLACLPVAAVLFRSERYLLSAALFLAGMATDCVDGWLARRLGQQSELGAYLDPVVDKIVLLGLLYELGHARILDWPVPHLFLARELLHSAVRSAGALRGSLVGANWMGKTKALLQTMLVAAGLALPALDAGYGLGAIRWAAWGVLALAWAFFFTFAYWNRMSLLSRPVTEAPARSSSQTPPPA